MTEQEQSYMCTTDSNDYKEWAWFQEHLEFIAAYKAGRLPKPKWDFQGGPLPLEYGVAYAEWILNTPEIRDIIYRRFILGHYDNMTEGNLLSDAVTYFSRKIGINTHAGVLLSHCHRPIAKILQGQITGPKAPEYAEVLLRSKYAFVDEP